LRASNQEGPRRLHKTPNVVLARIKASSNLLGFGQKMRVSLAEIARGNAALFNATSHVTVAAISCTHQEQHISQHIKAKAKTPLYGYHYMDSPILHHVNHQAQTMNTIMVMLSSPNSQRLPVMHMAARSHFILNQGPYQCTAQAEMTYICCATSAL